MGYRITFQCTTCGCKFKKTLQRLDAPDPACPNLACGAQQETRGMDFDSTRAPAAVGMSVNTKAIDETAKIVMRDHGMTDLKDNVRQGDVMAPKLAPHLQKQADNMFGWGRKRASIPLNTANIARTALAGGYSVPNRDPVQLLHDTGQRVPTTILNKG